MSRTARALLLAAAVAASPRLAGAQAAPGPLGLTGSLSLAGGAELGLDKDKGLGKPGLGELEGAVGFELASLGLRPELALALGLSPETSIAVRPGVRLDIQNVPFQLRAALDASTARRSGLHWRWLLLGIAGEIRFTSVLGLFAEIDSGAPLSSAAGLPLLVRGGAQLRF